MRSRSPFLLGVAVLAISVACESHPPPDNALGPAESIAPGVELYRNHDTALVGGAGAIAVSILRLDPARVRLTSALSNEEVLEAETVEDMARRLGAIAAVNGGFFNQDNGEPIGLLKVAGDLVSDTGLPRGVVIIHAPPFGPTTLAFDQLAAKATHDVHRGRPRVHVPVDGVDTTRARGKLMVYTPAYHADTDTAPTGTEWVLDDSPLKVRDVRMNFGHTKIPPRGAVLSYGGTDLPENLAALVEGVRVSFHVKWRSAHGLMDSDLDEAEHIVNGAGLLRREGEVLRDWKVEGLNAEAFTNARHPRTLVGVDREGFIWLAAVDGRQPDHSIGMTFEEMQRLCDRLGLVSALNLDGGGSTTMVVKGRHRQPAVGSRRGAARQRRDPRDAAIARPFRMSTMTDLQSHLCGLRCRCMATRRRQALRRDSPDRSRGHAHLVRVLSARASRHARGNHRQGGDGSGVWASWGRWQLADQIDSSHRFFYAHRYWPQVKLAVQNAAAPFAEDLAALASAVATGRRAPRACRSRVPARHRGGRTHDLPSSRRGRICRRARSHPPVREGAGHVPASGIEEARS